MDGKMKFFGVDGFFNFGSMPLTRVDVKELEKQKIKTVVSLAPVSNKVSAALKAGGITHFTVNLDAIPKKDYFRSIIVSVLRMHNPRMFVHCVLGESLSPSVAIGYLVSKGVPVERAIETISSKTKYKPIMNPKDFGVFASLNQSFKIRQNGVRKNDKKFRKRRFRG